MDLASSAESRLVLEPQFASAVVFFPPRVTLLSTDSRATGSGSRSRRTQSLFQSLDISTLGTALPPDLVIGTVVTQPRTCATSGAVAVASELPLPTYHTSQALGLWYIGIVGWMGSRGACSRWGTGFHLDGEGVLCLLCAIHGRVRVWRRGHGDGATDRPVGLRELDGCAAASGGVRSRATADSVREWCLVRPERPGEQSGVDTRWPWVIPSECGRGPAWGSQLVRMTK